MLPWKLQGVGVRRAPTKVLSQREGWKLPLMPSGHLGWLGMKPEGTWICGVQPRRLDRRGWGWGQLLPGLQVLGQWLLGRHPRLQSRGELPVRPQHLVIGGGLLLPALQGPVPTRHGWSGVPQVSSCAVSRQLAEGLWGSRNRTQSYRAEA